MIMIMICDRYPRPLQKLLNLKLHETKTFIRTFFFLAFCFYYCEGSIRFGKLWSLWEDHHLPADPETYLDGFVCFRGWGLDVGCSGYGQGPDARRSFCCWN